MTNGLTVTQTKILTYAVYAVLFVLSSITAWLAIQVYAMPEKYVRLERYQADTKRVERQLECMNSKLDRLIEAGLGR
ncbi:MAG TPA: hypothetical protein DHV36_12400 [Desulfobacteraceae bacterium]|nr:hypothetical protein [Desulfobacteraceae bacterium]|tara:strand:+ start:864 stop:1094 length:231 start_codon:yes stop_codon:yes gene_type:complete